MVNKIGGGQLVCPLISIVTAVTDVPVWAELLIKSIRLFTAIEHEVIVIDNCSLLENLAWLRKQKDIRLISNTTNIFHGGAMDQGTELARGRYVCHMDSDSHFQRSGWDKDMISLYHENSLTRLVCKGGPIHIGKPVHPPIFFYERDFILNNKLSFRHLKDVPKSTDTAQAAYWDILDLGFKVKLLARGSQIYDRADGDEIWINGQPTMYHHHYGTRLRHQGNNTWKWYGWKLPESEIIRHEMRTAALFEQPSVERIMKEGER